MKRGKQVAVCQDGKWSRAVPGVITKTSNGNKILVKFTLQDGTEAESWFRSRRRGTKFGGPRKVWNGWAETTDWCPWYTIVDIKRLKSEGITVTLN